MRAQAQRRARAGGRRAHARRAVDARAQAPPLARRGGTCVDTAARGAAARRSAHAIGMGATYILSVLPLRA